MHPSDQTPPGRVSVRLEGSRASWAIAVALVLIVLLVCRSNPAVAGGKGTHGEHLDGPINDGEFVNDGESVNDGEIVRIAYASKMELARLGQRLDIWEVVTPSTGSGEAGSPAAGFVVARISLTDAHWLHDQGIAYAVLPASPSQTLAIPDYPCYRTVDELYAQVALWAGNYPALTELFSLGSSYEDRPLWVLRLTNKATGLDKPVLFVMANVHGRELITPETAMAFAELLLEGYGVDADVTWILDQHRVEVLVTANPDGHVRNEAGYPWSYWRKNANPTYGLCGSTDFGVDLNRNAGYAWGTASSDPCSPTYQGPFAASEAETQSVEVFLRELFPDQRPPGESAVPLDASGLFISLHSYSNLVLWPWGYTTTAAPNAAQLTQLGRKLASFNGYTAQQASALYRASGTTDDFAYGELGVASYTFEIGSAADGFYPSCARYDALIQPNLDALLYAAKVARTPYLSPAGPDALSVTAAAQLDTEFPIITITAGVDDRSNGGLAITGAEVYLDSVPWHGGDAVPLTAADGTFDNAMETVTGVLPLTTTVADFTQSRHMVLVRGADVAGAWGPLTAAFVTTPYALALAPERATGAGRPGTIMTYTLWLTSTGSLTQTLSLTHTVAQWTTTLVPTQTSLAAFESAPITLTVSIPSEVSSTVADAVTVTVRSGDVPWLTKSAALETHMLWASFYIPFLVRMQ